MTDNPLRPVTVSAGSEALESENSQHSCRLPVKFRQSIYNPKVAGKFGASVGHSHKSSLNNYLSVQWLRSPSQKKNDRQYSVRLIEEMGKWGDATCRYITVCHVALLVSRCNVRIILPFFDFSYGFVLKCFQLRRGRTTMELRVMGNCALLFFFCRKLHSSSLFAFSLLKTFKERSRLAKLYTTCSNGTNSYEKLPFWIVASWC